jgi:putative oxidoreductase
MDILHRFEYWGDHHHPKWVDVIRIALGVFLCYKGIDFLRHTSLLISLMSGRDSFGSFFTVFLAHVVPFVHIVGGILLVIGLFTRFACLIQIPVLIGAIIFVHAAKDVLLPYSELFVTIAVLLLLVYFLIIGNGPLSFKLTEEKKRQVTDM